jgi:hypothetical protein
VNARELLEGYAESGYQYGAWGFGTPQQKPLELKRDQVASKAFTALRAVLDLHAPVKWYEDCKCPDRWESHDGSHFYVGDGEILTCEKSRVQDRCGECSPDNADDLDWPSVKYPCPTVRAIADALRGESQ